MHLVLVDRKNSNGGCPFQALINVDRASARLILSFASCGIDKPLSCHVLLYRRREKEAIALQSRKFFSAMEKASVVPHSLHA